MNFCFNNILFKFHPWIKILKDGKCFRKECDIEIIETEKQEDKAAISFFETLLRWIMGWVDQEA